ncbi:phosphoribosylanthranilate isomerase [Moheibacter sediminis]|uniref:N-(5'-phosphoribosyl)anthranilate isomerase n=1 Tax=Moheibacter sediminis TaxID=1434700 RepID=A0A1W1YIV0_9FLAO|nr:phosphoribosylanthranilate isomerase [Moheibacter sediminis]SMC36105.1 phosphoribosylanthranilate isomerase [Moheibacter sediminis]
MEIKICGMKYNVREVAALQPDYLGFIFYDKSARNFENEMPALNSNIKKVGVFVDEKISVISKKVKELKLNVIQLHGNESESYCQELKCSNPEIEIWKAFSVDEKFDFESIKVYKSIDKILLDTKGENPGGNGHKFNWKTLENIKFGKLFILSGGINSEDAQLIKNLKEKNSDLVAIDLNSGFEIKSGFKDFEKLRRFIKELKEII